MSVRRSFAAAAALALVLAACDQQPATITSPDADEDAVTLKTSPTSWANLDLNLSKNNGPMLASNLGQPVPADLIVSHNGLEWVWASPCALNGCTSGIDVGHDGFNFATQEQFDARPPESAFHGKCASPYFDHMHNHCDQVNLDPGPYFNSYKYGSAPMGGLPTADGNPMVSYAETLLVRVADPQTKDDCKDGGWEKYGFKNQGQCVRFIETGKDSR